MSKGTIGLTMCTGSKHRRGSARWRQPAIKPVHTARARVELGRSLRALREGQGLTIFELATALGWSEDLVRGVEEAKTRLTDARYEDMLRWCNGLKVRP